MPDNTVRALDPQAGLAHDSPMARMIDGPRLAPASGGAPDSLVILVHGFGANGADLIGLAPYWRDAIPGAAFVSPDAPDVCPGSVGGYQWWPIGGFGPAERLAGVERAATFLNPFIDQELERLGLGEDRLVLVGFSQGTMLSLHTALARPRPVAGVIGYSGLLIDEDGLPNRLQSRPPILLIHGDADPVVPFAAFERAKAALERNGLPLETYVAPGVGHSIDAEGLRRGEQFLKRMLAPAR